uniref:Uncharacterized protein n=1 Tax=Meloidogyne enterolobii TaxID=390850 RepID=A0A6V7WBW6_MELEN|nr:unnamed protein product [Meloidogyne enterolobii]
MFSGSSPQGITSPSSRGKSLDKFSIDTSRAKSNAPVVSFCARQLGLKEFTEPRDDGHPCDIYWHSIVFPDMNSVVKSGARVNKFPGKFYLMSKIFLKNRND